MLVQEIMTKKVESINSDEPVMETCKKYKEHKLGSLIVKEEDSIVGIITERDVIEKIAPKSSLIGPDSISLICNVVQRTLSKE